MSRERETLDEAVNAFEAAAEAIYKAADKYARAELRALSCRLPKRRIEYLSGMGACFINIEKRGVTGEYHITEAYGDTPGGHQLNTPEFLTVLAEIERDTGLRGMGDGCHAFKNGRPVR